MSKIDELINNIEENIGVYMDDTAEIAFQIALATLQAHKDGYVMIKPELTNEGICFEETNTELDKILSEVE